MAVYAASTDYAERYSNDELLQLTDFNQAGQVDQTVFGLAAQDASSEIDSYLGNLNVLPLATVPPKLVQVCCALIRYYLYKNDRPQAVLDGYSAACKWLRDVANGVAQLNPAAQPEPDAGDLVPIGQAAPRVMTRCKLDEFLHPGRYSGLE